PPRTHRARTPPRRAGSRPRSRSSPPRASYPLVRHLGRVRVGTTYGTDDDRFGDETVNEAVEVALSGVAVREVTADVACVARRIGPGSLRTLDAVHLASAVPVDADVVIAYDARLAAACRSQRLAVSAP